MSRYSQGDFPDAELYGYCNFILEFLQSSRKRSLQFWNDPSDAITKADLSPVTELDRGLEQEFRDLASKRYPSHGVIGEEFGISNPGAELQWIIDPIDGTMNLVNRVPTFGTIVALAYRGYPIVGAIDHPLLNICYYGGEQIGAFDISGAKLPIYPQTGHRLENLMVASAAPNAYKRIDATALLEGLVRTLPHLRIYYDCFGHSMTISGGIGASIECGLRIWDIAAVMTLVRARGGAVYELGAPWNGDPGTKIKAIIGQEPFAKELHDLVIRLYPQILT